MANRTVALVLRVKVGEKYPYLRPAMTSNGRVRAGYGLLNGIPTYFKEGVYYLRFTENRKLKLINVGGDLDVALVELRRRANLLEAKVVGNAVIDTSASPRLKLAEAIERYCTEISARKSKRTADGYERVLRLFERGCPKTYLDELDRDDLIAFTIQMKKQGLSNRTAFNYTGYVDTFLRKFGIPKLLKPQDWPKFVEKRVRVYDREDLKKLLAPADEDFRLVLRFFLASGCREAEVATACWRDLDFRTGEFTVCAKSDLGFSPKDSEERAIPLPSDLLLDLQERRKAHPHARLLFPTKTGKVQGHFLRQLKELALAARLNCRACVKRTASRASSIRCARTSSFTSSVGALQPFTPKTGFLFARLCVGLGTATWRQRSGTWQPQPIAAPRCVRRWISDKLRAAGALMDAKQLAGALGCHRDTIYGWVYSGSVPFVRVGCRIKFDPGAIADWLAKRSL